MERTRLRGAPNTASAGPIAVSIRLSNARLRVRETADFARRIHSRIRIGPERPREGAIDATTRKSCFRASPGINVAFPDLVCEGDVSLQALAELNQRQLPCAAKVFMEKIMSDARYYVGDHDVWMIKFEDGEYGPCASRDEAFVFAIDAAVRPCVRGG